MKLLAFAALLGLASAACPNQCSGHGRCSEFDKCVCNQQEGTKNPYRYAYTGVDCSLRTCPTGRAYDQISTGSSALGAISYMPASINKAASPKLKVFYNPSARNDAFKGMRRDQKFLVKVMSTDFASSPQTATFTWKLEEDEYYQPETTFMLDASKNDYLQPEYARHLTKSGGIETGVFVFFDQYLGGAPGWKKNAVPAIQPGDVYSFSLSWNDLIEFNAGDSNSAHQYLECSGRGTCDYASGKCKCMDGYTGEACQRTACPNQCSGHGQCQSEERFVKDAKSTFKYEAYDALQQYGCRCDDGYRGPDCAQIECPSGADILGGDGGAEGMDCSGRGICDYSTGVCKCHKGYYGERCESQTNFV